MWNLLSSLLDPLAEDTVPALLVFYGPMFATWGVTGFAASRRTGRVMDGIKAGATHYVTHAPFKILVATAIGVISVIGRILGAWMVGNQSLSRAQRPQ